MKHLLIIPLFLFVFVLYQIAEAKVERQYDFFRNYNFTESSPIPWRFPPIQIMDYKRIRAKEICDMAKSKGFREDQCPILLAHLLIENGALSEHRDGDNGCSLGMIQWNFCVHENMKARKWVALHPEWGEWRFQVNFYLDQINLRTEKYGSLTRGIASWNWGAHPSYIAKVKRHVNLANSLLY